MKNSTIFNFVTSIINGGLQSNQKAESLTAIPALHACLPMQDGTSPLTRFHSVKTFFTKKLSFCVLAIAIVTLNVTPASAQDGEWNFLIEPYFMIPQMNGEIGVRQLPPGTVDASPDDIFSNLRMAAMLYFEADHVDKYAFSSDIIFMDLKQEAKPGQIVTGGDAFAKQISAEFAWLKHITPWFDLGAAARITDIKADLKLETAAGPREGSNRKTWVDPVIIARAQTDLQDKWILEFRGDIGGFGIGSDLTWQVQANAGYRFSKLVHAKVGYRLLDIDYEDGDGAERFMYDIATSGIVVKVGFNF